VLKKSKARRESASLIADFPAAAARCVER